MDRTAPSGTTNAHASPPRCSACWSQGCARSVPTAAIATHATAVPCSAADTLAIFMPKRVSGLSTPYCRHDATTAMIAQSDLGHGLVVGHAAEGRRHRDADLLPHRRNNALNCTTSAEVRDTACTH